MQNAQSLFPPDRPFRCNVLPDVPELPHSGVAEPVRLPGAWSVPGVVEVAAPCARTRPPRSRR